MDKNAETRPLCWRAETFTLVITIFVLLLVSVSTLTRWPMVWVDEPYFIDPAANLAATGKLLSEFAFATAKDEAYLRCRVWPGNCPLYSIVLAGWISAFGLNLIAVRSLNLLIYSAGTLLLTASVLRHATSNRVALSAIGPALFFSCYPMPMMYRSCRYDAMCFLEGATTIYALTLPSSRWSRCLLAVSGFLLPWTGLPSCLLMAAAVGVGIVVRKELRVAGFAFFAATVAGTLAFVIWLAHYDALQVFLAHARSVQNRADNSFGLWPTIIQVFVSDRSTAVLWMVSVVLLAAAWRMPDWHWRKSPVVAGMAITVAACFVRSVASSGRYPWMSTAVLGVGCLAELGRMPSVSGASYLPSLSRLAWAGIGTSMFMLPAVTAVALTEWRARDHARVVSFVEDTITADDVVLCDYSAYLACKPVAGRTIADSGARGWLPGDFVDVDDFVNRGIPFSVAVVRPERSDEMIKRLGGRWRQVATLPAEDMPYLRPTTSLSRILLRCLAVIYPPSLSTSANQRIAPDRPYSLVVLRPYTP